MATVTKIAPKREGQRKEVTVLEERMHNILSQIGEYDRILRQAQEAEENLRSLRAELAKIAGEYADFLSRREGA